MTNYEDEYAMTDSTAQANRFRNRLITEASPYLLQHAENPVEWYPWGEEACAGESRGQADSLVDRVFGLPLVPCHGA